MSLAYKHEASRETLLTELLANEKRIEELQERNDRLRERIEALAPPPPARIPAKGQEETFRDAVVTLGSFTIHELAAHLAWSPQRARKHLQEWIDGERAKETNFRFGGQKVYEYLPPTDVGDGFRQDQKIRRPDPGPPLTGPGSGLDRGAATGGPLYQQVSSKEVRDVCKWAEERGWTLSRKGDGHFRLTKGAQRVGVPGTPKNGSGAAVRIKSQVLKAEQGRAPRRVSS